MLKDLVAIRKLYDTQHLNKRLTMLWLMNQYKLVLTSRFKKDLKQCVKRNYDIAKIEIVVDLLLSGDKLPEQYRDHNLTGNWNGHRGCHIEPDWLLVYRIEDDILVLTLARTGTHSDLFD